jgi:hypothetical protein
VNASAQRVNDKFRDRDQYGADSLVANAEDLLAIADNDQVDVVRVAPLYYIVLDAVCILNVEETPLRLTKQPRVVGYRFAFGWCVDDGEHFLQMAEDQLSASQRYTIALKLS